LLFFNNKQMGVNVNFDQALVTVMIGMKCANSVIPKDNEEQSLLNEIKFKYKINDENLNKGSRVD